jgi:hypothetical protein
MTSFKRWRDVDENPKGFDRWSALRWRSNQLSLLTDTIKEVSPAPNLKIFSLYFIRCTFELKTNREVAETRPTAQLQRYFHISITPTILFIIYFSDSIPLSILVKISLVLISSSLLLVKRISTYISICSQHNILFG